jgi:hypothetical protein
MYLEFASSLPWGPGVHLQHLFAADSSLGTELFLSFGNKHFVKGWFYVYLLPTIAFWNELPHI